MLNNSLAVVEIYKFVRFSSDSPGCFQGDFRGISEEFQGVSEAFRGKLWIFQGSLRGVVRRVSGGIRSGVRGFKDTFKEFARDVSDGIQWASKRASIGPSVFQNDLRGTWK